MTRLLSRLAYTPATQKLFCALAEHRLQKTKNNPRKLFYARNLIMLYLHVQNYTRATETLLLSMAEQFTEPEYAAYINRGLYRNKGDDEHRKTALMEFTELFKLENQNKIYEDMIEELKKT